MDNVGDLKVKECIRLLEHSVDCRDHIFALKELQHCVISNQDFSIDEVQFVTCTTMLMKEEDFVVELACKLLESLFSGKRLDFQKLPSTAVQDSLSQLAELLSFHPNDQVLLQALRLTRAIGLEQSAQLSEFGPVCTLVFHVGRLVEHNNDLVRVASMRALSSLCSNALVKQEVNRAGVRGSLHRLLLQTEDPSLLVPARELMSILMEDGASTLASFPSRGSDSRRPAQCSTLQYPVTRDYAEELVPDGDSRFLVVRTPVSDYKPSSWGFS